MYAWISIVTMLASMIACIIFVLWARGAAGTSRKVEDDRLA